MIKKRLSAGIEFGHQQARIALIAPGPVPEVLRCAEVNVPVGDEHRLAALAADALVKMGGKTADVHLAFAPPSPKAMRHGLFATPRLRRGELQLVAERELRKDALGSPETSYLAAEPLDAFTEERVQKQANILVALDKETLEQPAKILFGKKFVVRSATTSPMALWRLWGVTEAPQSDDICAMVLMGYGRSYLLVLENGVPRFLRDIPTNFAQGTESKDDLLKAEALGRELDISLVYFAQQHRPRHVETVVVVGDTALADGVADWIEDGGGYNVLQFGPSAKLTAGKDAPEDLLPYAVAIGAALGPKTRTLPDVLPGELRSHPERAYALGAASVVLVLLIFLLVQLRTTRLDELEVAEARIRVAQSTFDDLEEKLKKAGALDSTAARAAKWREHFDAHDNFHKQLGRLLHQLPGAVPKSTYLKRMQWTAVDRDPRAIVRAEAPQWKLMVEGVALAGDLGGAQSELRRFTQAFEELPTVKGIDLKPIRAPVTITGTIELPFTFDAAVYNPFTGKGVR